MKVQNVCVTVSFVAVLALKMCLQSALGVKLYVLLCIIYFNHMSHLSLNSGTQGIQELKVSIPIPLLVSVQRPSGWKQNSAVVRLRKWVHIVLDLDLGMDKQLAVYAICRTGEPQ